MRAKTDSATKFSSAMPWRGASMLDLLEAKSRAGKVRPFLRLAAGYWTGTARLRAWLLAMSVLAMIIANLATALAVNRWNKLFFDAIEQKQTRSFILAIFLILMLAALSAAFSAGLLHARMRLQVRWRQWLTQTLIGRWLADRRFYQLTIVSTAADNPEARIAEDTRLAIELLVDLSLGILNAILAAVSFVSVLWVVGGPQVVAGYSIPGHMVFACAIYSALTTFCMLGLGRPLIRRVEAKAAAEAQLRYELTRIKDNAETIALSGGDAEERERLEVKLSDAVHRWFGVIAWQRRMMWVNGANLVLAPVIPLLLGAPKYLSGDMSLGSLVQAATAFLQVQLALNWLADNAPRLADWFASSHRVTQLSDALDRLEASFGQFDPVGAIRLASSPDDRVHFRRLTISLHDGALSLADGDAVILPREKVLITGEPGDARGALIHAMAGLWPWGSGEILTPQGKSLAFMPQRPYLPLGTLRAALKYPRTDRDIADESARDMLTRCGLEHLIPDIDADRHWAGVLSDSEQQRLAFARVLIHRPDILIMDRPTSAMDELSQFKMMELIRDLLPDTMVIHAAHRSGLERFHDRKIRLVRKGPATSPGTTTSDGSPGRGLANRPAASALGQTGH